MLLNDKVAIVTGAASCIGRASALPGSTSMGIDSPVTTDTSRLEREGTDIPGGPEDHPDAFRHPQGRESATSLEKMLEIRRSDPRNDEGPGLCLRYVQVQAEGSHACARTGGSRIGAQSCVSAE